jgi:hypothetical protein
VKDAANTFRSFLDGKCQEIKYQSEAFKQGGQKASVVQSELEKRYQVVHKQIGNVFDEVSLI